MRFVLLLCAKWKHTNSSLHPLAKKQQHVKAIFFLDQKIGHNVSSLSMMKMQTGIPGRQQHHRYTILLLNLFTDTCLLKIPLYKCTTKSDCAFSFFGPSVWNSLPLHIRNTTTIDTFKSALKTHLFNLQESD